MKRRSQDRDYLLIIRQWMEETGSHDIDMDAVAEWAHRVLGTPYPSLPSPVKLLAKKLARAAREDIRYDDETRKPYRGLHPIRHTGAGGEQYSLWFDIDDSDTTRKKMEINITQRRESMVGDALQLKRDADHWNRVNSEEEPLEPQLDLTFDVELREHYVDEGADPDEDGDQDD